MQQLRSGRVRVALASALLTVCVASGLGAAMAADREKDKDKESRGEAPARGTAVRAMLEMNQQFYYAGAPLQVRLSIGNEGDAAVTNPVRTSIPKAFTVRTGDGTLLEPKGQGAHEPARLEKLPPNNFYGAVIDLTEMYPQLREPGQYTIAWAAEGVTANDIRVRVIPRYDPAREYRARVETSEGAFVIDFLPKTSPLAVKSFIDMAHAGYYDGLLIHEVHPAWYVVGGDPGPSGVERVPFAYPAEQSTIPVVAGTVLMRPVGMSPPANGSPFMIMLRSEPSWSGQATVLGQVVEGLDVVDKISRLPNSEQASRPFFKPLKDVTIRTIVVSEKKPAAAS